MTIDETMEILAMLKVAYPQQLNKITEPETVAMAKLWQGIFARTPKEIMELAVSKIVKTAIFFPSIAEMVQALRQIWQEAEFKLRYDKYTDINALRCFEDDYEPKYERNYDEETERKLQFIADGTSEFATGVNAVHYEQQKQIKGEN